MRAGRNRARVTVLVGPVEVAHVGRPLPSHSGTALKWLATTSNRRHHAARLLDEALKSDLARALGRPAEAQADEDRLALGRLCSFAAKSNMLQHSPTCCNTVQHVAAQYTTLQHGATCCNPVQHVATQCTISQDRLALGRLNRTAAIDALCENVLSIMRFYRLCLCEGASRQAWEAWAQGRARVLCAWRAHAWAVWGRRLHVVDRGG